MARFTCSERKRKADNSAEKPPVWILPPISDHYAFLRAKKDLEVVNWLLKKSRFRESFSSKEKELNGLKTITSIAPWIALNTNSREDPLTPTILHLLQNYHKALVHRSKRPLIGKTRRNRGINQYENGARIRQRFPELIIHKYLLVPYCVYASLSDSSRVDNYSVKALEIKSILMPPFRQTPAIHEVPEISELPKIRDPLHSAPNILRHAASCPSIRESPISAFSPLAALR